MIQPGILWGVATAAAWGIADFGGGLASRRVAPMVVTAASTVIGLVVLAGLVTVVRPAAPQPETLVLGALAGMAGGLGLACLYQALSLGAMGLVSALSGAGAALIPVVVTALLGTELPPLTIIGIASVMAAALAAADISRDAAGRSALLLSMGAAIGFAAWYLILDRAATDHGLWALVASRTGSSVLLVTLVAVGRSRASVRDLRLAWPLVVVAGILDVSANAFFVLARDAISVAIVAPLSGLYPLATMALARVVIGERLPRLGMVSVILAVAGIVLISVGG